MGKRHNPRILVHLCFFSSYDKIILGTGDSTFTVTSSWCCCCCCCYCCCCCCYCMA